MRSIDNNYIASLIVPHLPMLGSMSSPLICANAPDNLKLTPLVHYATEKIAIRLNVWALFILRIELNQFKLVSYLPI